MFEDYISSFERGNDRAAQKMVDFWFGSGAFERMPDALRAFLLKETASNIRDVRATFRQEYSHDAFRTLDMPLVVVVGARSPDTTYRIAQAIAEHAPMGSVVKLDGANHALTTTHADAVAEAIASIVKSRE